MRLILLCLSFLVFSNSWAFDFKDIKLGSQLADIESSGRFTCRDIKSPIADQTCTLKFNQKETIAGAKVNLLVLFITDAKLTHVSVEFSHRDFDEVSSAFITKYGEPDKDEMDTAANRMGASFSNRKLTWTDSDSTLKLKERSRKIDISSATFSLNSSVESFEKRSSEQAQERANDL